MNVQRTVREWKQFLRASRRLRAAGAGSDVEGHFGRRSHREPSPSRSSYMRRTSLPSSCRWRAQLHDVPRRTNLCQHTRQPPKNCISIARFTNLCKYMLIYAKKLIYADIYARMPELEMGPFFADEIQSGCSQFTFDPIDIYLVI